MSRLRTSLDAMLAAHGAALLSHARLLVGDGRGAALLEDALTEVYGGWRRPTSSDTGARAVRRTMRSRAYRESGASDMPWPSPEAVLAVGTAGALRAATGAMSARERCLLAMRYVDGLSAEAIASEVGAPLTEVTEHLGTLARRLVSSIPGSGLGEAASRADVDTGGGWQPSAEWITVEAGGPR